MILNISLILTSQGGYENIKRLFASLEENIINSKNNSKISVIFVAQDMKPDLIVLPYHISKSIKIIHSERMPLSKARNIGLQYVNFPVDLIGFPDDDCWYPSDFFNQINREYNSHNEIIVTSVYDPCSEKYYGGRKFQKSANINSWNILKIPISVAIFIPIKSFKCLKVRFKEDVGAGNIIGSGEETIYLAHQMILLGKKATFLPYLRVFHENENAINLKKTMLYSIGFGYTSMYLVFFYRMLGVIPYLFFIILKGVIASFIFVCSPKRSLNYLIRSVSIVIGVLSYFFGKRKYLG